MNATPAAAPTQPALPASPAAPGEALRPLLARARHDLRNPLGHIIGFSEMLGEEARARGFFHFVADFEAITEAANQLIGEITLRLDAKALEAGLEHALALRSQIKSLATRIHHIADGLIHLAQAFREDVFSPDLARISHSARQLVDLADSALSFLPAQLSEASARTEAPALPAPRPRTERPTAIDPLFQPGKEGTILVVDDLEANRALLHQRLSRLGYTVQLRENGRQALEYLACSPADLVLLDVMMPELDGFQTLASLKDNPRTRTLPVIMLSSSDDAATVVQCIKLGADDFLPKPFNTTLLLARIEASLAKKKLRELTSAHESFFYDKGTLQPASPSYVERAADKQLLDRLLANEFCYVLTSRQMGKSSLMARSASRLREQGVNVVTLDLTAIGQNLTPEQWYDGLVIRLGRQLRLEDEMEEFWATHERLSPVQRFFTGLRDVAMVHHRRPLVVFVDELDTVRSLPFCTDEFFAAIRECHNRRTEDPEFQRLTFCLLGVARPSDLIRHTRTTPFNVARAIELQDFTEREAEGLAGGLEREKRVGEHLLHRVLHWTRGHPYLTQRFCRAIAEDRNITRVAQIDRLCQKLFLSAKAREEDDNLQFVRRLLLRDDQDLASSLRLYAQVLRRRRVPFDPAQQILVDRLRLAGVIRIENNALAVRNRIYLRVFDLQWVAGHLGEATDSGE